MKRFSLFVAALLLAAPAWAQIDFRPAASGGITGGTCTNQFVQAISSGGVVTCATVGLATDVSGNLAGPITIGTAFGADAVTNGTFTGNATGWTLGLGGGAPDWAYATNNVTHGNGGGTATLEPSTPLTVVAGRTYRVTFTISALSAGTVTASIGGASGTAASVNGTYVQTIVAADTTNLKFTPTTTLVATIDTISVLESRATTLKNATADQMVVGPPAMSEVVGRLSIIETGSTIPLRIFEYGTGTQPVIQGIKALGTQASPSAVGIDNNLFVLNGLGYGTTGYSSGARATISFKTVEAWTDTAQGTYIRFDTTPATTASSAERMRLMDNGHLGVGSATSTFGRLTVDNGAVAEPIATFQDATAALPTTGPTATTTIMDGAWIQAGNGVLTSATMTAETQARDSGSLIHSYTWSVAQVNTALGAGTTGDVTVATLPAKTVVKNAYVVITQAAAGPVTLTVACGRTSATFIDYIVASDAKAAANTVYGDAAAERGTNLVGYDLPSYTGTTTVTCHFVAGDTTDLTTGTGRVILETSLVP